jgi:hypothetical protein
MIHYRLAVHHEKFLQIEVAVKKFFIPNKHFFKKGNRMISKKGGVAGCRTGRQGGLWPRGFSGGIRPDLVLDQMQSIL